MPRLTISLSEERHRALKEAAVRRNKSIAALIEESLEQYGIKTTESAAALVARSRRTAGLKEDVAREIALRRPGAPATDVPRSDGRHERRGRASPM